MHSSNRKRFAILVVLYQADQQTLDFWHSVSAIHPLMVIDNSQQPLEADAPLRTTFRYYHNANQGGIAGALNVGLTKLTATCQWCFLFDQDSRPTPQYFSMMATNIARHEHDKLALCAPVHWEQNRNYLADIIEVSPAAVLRHSYKNIRYQPAVNTSYAITSGSALNLANWLTIGRYDESLFLDFVDIEWGLKATHAGYQILSFPDVVMKHTLGDTPIRLGKIAFVCHNPDRHYLYFRNVVFMLRRDHVPRAWKKMELLKLLPRFAVYALLTKKRIQHIKAMSKGLLHGIFPQLIDQESSQNTIKAEQNNDA
jgi:rhamnosyltransferase